MYRQAKESARQRHNTIEFQFRRRYSLTENDPRFLDLTTEEMLADIWAHKFFEDPKALEEVEDEDFDPDDVARQLGYGDDNLPNDFEDV